MADEFDLESIFGPRRKAFAQEFEEFQSKPARQAQASRLQAIGGDLFTPSAEGARSELERSLGFGLSRGLSDISYEQSLLGLQLREQRRAEAAAKEQAKRERRSRSFGNLVSLGTLAASLPFLISSGPIAGLGLGAKAALGAGGASLPFLLRALLGSEE